MSRSWLVACVECFVAVVLSFVTVDATADQMAFKWSSRFERTCFWYGIALVPSSDALVSNSDALVTTSKALVTSSDALVTTSFLLLLVRHLLLVAMHLLLLASS